MPKEKIKKKIWLFVLLLIIQLAAVYYIKYSNQTLPFSEFNIAFTGNLFLLIIYSCLIAILLINSLKEIRNIPKKNIISFLIVSWLLLVLAFLSIKFNIGLNKIYLLGQPGNKLLTGLLFTFFLIGLFSFVLYGFSVLFTKTKASLLKTVYGSTLMIIIFLLVTFVYINTLSYTSGKWQLTRSNNNIAVVLGAAVWSGNLPSPTLAGRVEKASELVKNGFAGRILVTGSSAPGELTEAEVAYNYLIAKGVDTTIISTETTTTSTTEQIRFVKNEIYDSPDIKDIIVISDSYHLPRVIEISRFFNLDLKVAESRHVLDFKDKLYNKVRESIALFIFWCFAL